MRDIQDGHTSGEVPYEHLPVVPSRRALGKTYKPPTQVREPVAPPDTTGVTVVTTIPAEPHMHVQFGTNRPLPVLAYAVWSNGRCTPIFHWPALGQIRACRLNETGWALLVVWPAEPTESA